ncbi:MAG: STAS domain-containing protein [Deltaproteobacteria bacterium]|nr:STAS domain-containing protein [Deltaproteobacteria bacterium]MCW5809243.1 STAS domain-containing protein [Deltaproteobacteria bacterium]
MPTPFEVQRHPTETRLAVRGSLDINTAPSLAEEIDAIIATRPPKVIVDLSGLDLIDSSGVAALVKLYKGVRGANGTVAITGARDQPLAIFKLLRMDKVFNL